MLQSYVYLYQWFAWHRDELAIAATKFDVVACAETKVTGRRHVSELLLPGFKAPTLLLRGARANGLGMALFARSGLSVSRRKRFECSCCEFMVAKIPGQRLNYYLFVVYQSPSTDDRVFDWNAVCEGLSGLNWRSIFRSPTMVHDFDREVSGIMEQFVPMVNVRRRGGDASWFDGDCRRAFELKQSAYHRWCRNRSSENWDLFCQARGIANRLYAAPKAPHSADCRRNLDDCASANAWWRTLKGHMFGAESDIPPLCSPGGALVSDPTGKAELLSTWFDSKQSRDIVELPQTCHPRPAFCGIAFRAREVERYLLDLDLNGGVDPSGCFPMFFWKTASVLAPKLSCLFR